TVKSTGMSAYDVSGQQEEDSHGSSEPGGSVLRKSRGRFALYPGRRISPCGPKAQPHGGRSDESCAGNGKGEPHHREGHAQSLSHAPRSLSLTSIMSAEDLRAA